MTESEKEIDAKLIAELKSGKVEAFDKIVERYQVINDGSTLVMEFTFSVPEHWVGEWHHIKFRDKVLRSDVREANCIYKDNLALPGLVD